MRNLNFLRKSERKSVGTTLALTVGSPSAHRRYSALKHLAFMLLFLLGSLNVWGANVSWDCSTLGSSTITGPISGDIDDNISFSSTKGGADNATAYNKDGTIRLYYKNTGNGSDLTLTPDEGVTITEVILTAKSGYAVDFSYSIDGGAATAGSWSDLSATISDISATSSFKIVNKSTTTQLRLTNITITYSTGGGGKTDVTDEQLSWSASSATVTYSDEPYSLPSLTNTIPVSVSYQSTDETVATISNMGVVSILKAGSTTIKAVYAGSETLNAKTVQYTLTVNKAAPTPIVGGIQDVLDYSWHGKTSTTYGDVTAKTANNTGHSTAKYAANCAGGNTSIQLRSTNNSGFISTISAGYVKRVEIEWNDNTAAGRTLDIYGSNTAYTATSNLYNNATDGDLLGSLNIDDEETVLDFTDWTGDYKYIGFRSKSGAMFINSVTITWVPLSTYEVNLSNTGCTLNVQKGSTPVADNDKFEEGTQLTVSYSASEGYENAELVVKKTSDMLDVTSSVLSGSTLTMPAYGITIEATATKKQYTVTLAATNGHIEVGGNTETSIVVAHGETAVLTAEPNTDYAFNGWTSNSANVVLTDATVNPATITVTGAGTITANFISTAKLNPGFAWSDASAEAVKGQTASLPTLTSNPYSLTPTYVSTNTDVAEINNAGEVTIKAVGSTTIKATYDEDATYADCEATYTLTVKGRVTWHIIKDGVDAPETADYVKDAVPTKPTPSSCDASISLVGWTTSTYAKSDDEPATLYTGNVPAVTDNAEYYAVWAVVEEGGWNEITAVANLTAGTYAICSDHYFMKAVKVDSKNRLQNGGEPSISEGKLTSAPAADCQWTISINGDGKYLFQNGDKYAIATSTKNEMILSSAADIAEDAHAQWEIARSGSIFEVTNIGRAGDSDTPANKYLRNNTTSGWACYSSNQGGEGYAPRFFKYSAGATTGYTTNCVPPMTVATPTFTPDGSAAYYTEAQNVTINCATEGSVIYYTLDNTTPSKTNGTQYTAAINVAETKTIKAIAYVGDVASEVAIATFTLSLSTMDQIYAAATAIGGTAQERVITFGDWIVSAISSDEKSVYVTDNTKGFVIYVSGKDHGFAVGDVLSGTVECDLQLFAGFAEIKDLKASNTSLTVTTGGVLVPADAEIKNLGAVNTGAPVILSNVTYDSDGDLVDDESYYVKPDNMLYSDAVSTFEQDKIYNVTGVYVYGSTKKIAPRSAADIVKLSKEQQTITWYVSNAQAEAIGTSYTLDNKDVAFAPVCESNSTGAKTYQSSDPTVATINENTGVIEVLGNGVTTITCNVVGDENYVDGSKAFTLKVGIGEASWVAKDWATAESVASNTKMADKSPIAIDANLSMTWAKAEGSNDPIYHSDGEGRLYQKNTLTITASNSKQITRIEFHFTGTSTGTISANEGTYSAGVWTGFAPSVTFTNAPSASGAKIKSIDIEYAQGTTTTLVIEDMVILNDADATTIVYSTNKPGAVVVYSDYDDEVITIADGKITPVAKGNTTVKASIAAEAPYSSVSITFKVRVKSSSETVENVVILSQFGEGWIAMKHDFTAVEVEKAADGTILDLTCDEEDITWVMTADGASAMFQQPNTNKYLAVGSSNALVLGDAATIWTLSDDGYYYNVSGRTFLYQGGGAKYKNYAASNAGKASDGGYSGYATFVAPVFANREELRGGLTEGKWGTYCPDKEVKHPAGASFYTLTYMELNPDGSPYKFFFDEIAENASLAAGKPYLFIAEGDAIMGVKVGDAAEAGDHANNGFVGYLGAGKHITSTNNTYTAGATNYYGLQNNIFKLIYSTSSTENILNERAYVEISPSRQPSTTQVSMPAPGRRRLSVGAGAPQIATGLEDGELMNDGMVKKVLINGELFIIRGEKMYDATGRIVK